LLLFQTTNVLEVPKVVNRYDWEGVTRVAELEFARIFPLFNVS
jgi:hypothetical protein